MIYDSEQDTWAAWAQWEMLRCYSAAGLPTRDEITSYLANKTDDYTTLWKDQASHPFLTYCDLFQLKMGDGSTVGTRAYTVENRPGVITGSVINGAGMANPWQIGVHSPCASTDPSNPSTSGSYAGPCLTADQFSWSATRIVKQRRP